MSYQEEYRQKLTTAEEAVKVVKSGDWVDYGWCTNTAEVLDQALAGRMGELYDVKVRGGILLHMPAIAQIENPAEHFTWNSWHMGGTERKMAKLGLAYYAPIRYSELPGYYRDCIDPIDVAMFQVAPMDQHGYFNFGPNASHLYDMCARAKHIIVEVNENMPRCLGGYHTGVHISQVNAIVEGPNGPIGTMPGLSEPSEIDLAVARQIVAEIPNGACLQLGIGSMPGAVGQMIAQSDLKDLGVHTEMYVDAFVAMTKAGKITGARKNFDQGRQTYAFAAGTQELYDFLDNSKLFKGTVEKDSRSLMNVPFVTGDKELDAKFVAEAAKAGLVNLKGHRLTGGIRASIYNAMPVEGARALAEYMKEFEVEHHV